MKHKKVQFAKKSKIHNFPLTDSERSLVVPTERKISKRQAKRDIKLAKKLDVNLELLSLAKQAVDKANITKRKEAMARGNSILQNPLAIEIDTYLDTMPSLDSSAALFNSIDTDTFEGDLQPTTFTPFADTDIDAVDASDFSLFSESKEPLPELDIRSSDLPAMLDTTLPEKEEHLDELMAIHESLSKSLSADEQSLFDDHDALTLLESGFIN